jgi:hypothetical protein
MRMSWAGNAAHTGEKRSAYRVLFGKPQGKRPLARLRHGSDDSIKMDVKERG